MHQFFYDGQPSDAGVEHADGSVIQKGTSFLPESSGRPLGLVILQGQFDEIG